MQKNSEMWQKKSCVVLIEADIFNKAVQGNIPIPLRNLYTNFDVNTLRGCGEMACVEEQLHTFGNPDITILGLEIRLMKESSKPTTCNTTK